MRFELAPSGAMRMLTAAFALCCASGVAMAAAPRVGSMGYVAGAAVWAVLLALSAREAARRPDAVHIGPDGTLIVYRAGRPLAQGRLRGFSQWGAWLLALEFKPARGRARFLSIPADAAGGAEHFRALAVRVRQGLRGACGVSAQV